MPQMEPLTASALFRYLRACLLIVPYSAILIRGGHGAAPLGAILCFVGFGDPITKLGWIGIILALIAPLVLWKIYRTILITAAVAFLIASTIALTMSSGPAMPTGVLPGSLKLFYGCAAFFLILEWCIACSSHPNKVA